MSIDNLSWKELTKTFIEEELRLVESETAILRQEIETLSPITTMKPALPSPYLRILQINCNKSQTAFNQVLRWGEEEPHPPDVILISEPPVNRCKGLIRCDRQGVRIFHFESKISSVNTFFWTAIVVKNNGLNITFEPSWATPFVTSIVINRKNKEDVTLSVVYNHRELYAALDDILELVSRKKEFSIIGGDWNIHLTRWNNGKFVESSLRSLAHSMEDPFWYILNKHNCSTWKRNDSVMEELESGRNNPHSTIDYSLLSEDLVTFKEEWSVLSWPEGTDHALIEFKVFLKEVTPSRQGFRTISSDRICRKATSKLKKLDSFNELFSVIEETNSVLTAGSAFKLKGSLNTRRKLRDARKELRRWKSRKLKFKMKDKATKKIKKLNGKIMRLQAEIREEEKLLLKNNHNRRTRFNFWKSIPFGKNAPSALSSLIVGQERISNVKEMAKLIMEHLHKSRDHPPNKRRLSKKPCPQGEDLDIDEFRAAVSSLKNNRACGVDGHSTKLVKSLVRTNEKEIFELYADLFRGASLPKIWLNSKLFVLAKVNSSAPNLEKTRAIGVSSAWAKILEKICNDRLIYWSIELNVISIFQYGFIKGKNVIKALEDLFDTLDRKDLLGQQWKKLITKIDIKGAFDNVLPSDIIRTLTKKNFPKNLIDIIDQYMCNRKNVLTLDDVTLRKNKSLGTVQGAIFSPTLFNILLATVLTPFEKIFSEIERIQGVIIHMFVYADDIIFIAETRSPVSQRLGEEFLLLTVMDSVIKILELKLKSINLEISREKTGQMFWPTNAFHITNVDMESQSPVKFFKASSLTILGITLEPGSKGPKCPLKEHLRRKIEHAQRCTQALSNERSLTINEKRIIFKSMVMKSFSYGAHVWLPFTRRSSLDLLRSQYMDGLRRITGLKLHIPTIALTCMANLPPFEIEYKLELTKKELSMYGIVWNGSYFPPPPSKLGFSTNWNPANFPLMRFEGTFSREEQLPVQKEDEVWIYTDAAVDKNAGGIATVNLKEKKFLLFKTTGGVGSFELELKAIELAITNLHKLAPGKTNRIWFLTDSISVINALQNRNNNHYIVKCIRNAIVNLEKGVNTSIAWVKGHSNVSGNILADCLAKVASQFGEETIIHCTRSMINKKLEEELTSQWSHFYDSTDSSSFKKFYPSLDLARKFRPKNVETCRITSSHSEYLKLFLHRLKGWNSRNSVLDPEVQDISCECDGMSIQDGWHMVFICPLMEPERTTVIKTLGLESKYNKPPDDNTVRDKDFYAIVDSIAPLVEKKLKTIRSQQKLRS